MSILQIKKWPNTKDKFKFRQNLHTKPVCPIFGPVQSIISVLEAASKLMIGGLKCRGWAMVSYSSLADLKNYLKKWKMKLAWKHFYVLWIFKFSLFLCLILRTACRRTSLFSSLSIPMRIFSWWAKNPFHSSPWPWLELFGKSEHEEDVLSTILNGWIGLDVEVVGDVEAYIIFVIFSPRTKFWAQLFST